MRGRKILFAVLSLVASAVASAQAVELITNGGFERGFTGWLTDVEVFSGGGLFVVANDGGFSPDSGLPLSVQSPRGRTLRYKRSVRSRLLFAHSALCRAAREHRRDSELSVLRQ
jgi:hypothetical protein